MNIDLPRELSRLSQRRARLHRGATSRRRSARRCGAAWGWRRTTTFAGRTSSPPGGGSPTRGRSEHDGPGWSPLQCYLFEEEEMGRACAPRPVPFGVKMLGPVIYTFGSDAQKTKYLPAIAANETWWCQGYSEPNAGSDLARLGTRGGPERRPLHRQRLQDLDQPPPSGRTGCSASCAPTRRRSGRRASPSCSST